MKKLTILDKYAMHHMIFFVLGLFSIISIIFETLSNRGEVSTGFLIMWVTIVFLTLIFLIVNIVDTIKVLKIIAPTPLQVQITWFMCAGLGLLTLFAGFYVNGLIKNYKQNISAPSIDKEFKNSDDKNSGNALAWLEKGYELMEIGKHKEATEAFNKAKLLKDDCFDAQHYLKIGTWYYKINRYEDAEMQLRKAISMNSENVMAHIKLADTLVKLKKYSESEVEYREALKLKPDFALTHFLIANLLVELKRNNEAEEEYRRAIKIQPYLTVARYNLLKLLNKMGRDEEAAKEIDEIEKIQPDYKSAHYDIDDFLKDIEGYSEDEK